MAPMSIRTILSKVTLRLLLKVLAHLGLVVVVGDVKHFILYFDWQLLLTNERKISEI